MATAIGLQQLDRVVHVGGEAAEANPVVAVLHVVAPFGWCSATPIISKGTSLLAERRDHAQLRRATKQTGCWASPRPDRACRHRFAVHGLKQPQELRGGSQKSLADLTKLLGAVSGREESGHHMLRGAAVLQIVIGAIEVHVLFSVRLADAAEVTEKVDNLVSVRE